MGARPGFTTTETLVALAVGSLLIAGVVAVVTAVSRLERASADRAEILAALAHAGTVIGLELRALDARRDAFGIGPDSVGLRAFRGVAIACGGDSTEVEVRYRGIRAPDPAKDSLLVLAGAGTERSLPLVSVGSGGTVCVAQPGEVAVTLRPGAGVVPGDIVLIYERGTYHLSGGALRYRRGASGRQPLTPVVLLDDSTELTPLIASAPGLSPESVAVRLRTTAARLPGGSADRPVVLYVPLLNVPVPIDSVPVP